MAVPTVPVYVTEAAPPLEVVEVMEDGLVEHLRRIEIYEADGVTRWYPADSQEYRLLSGNVILDYSSDERRKLDLMLDNIDNALRPDPDDGFWYDKIIKVYRGLSYASSAVVSPLVIISETYSEAEGLALKNLLSGFGYDVTVDLQQRSPAGLERYAMVVAAEKQATGHAAYAATLQTLMNKGRIVVTIGTGDISGLPHYSASNSQSSTGIAPLTADNPAVGAFTSQAVTMPAADAIPTGVALGAQRIAQWPSGGSPTHVTAALVRSASGGFWFDLHLPDPYAVQANALLRHMLSYMKNIVPIKVWETPLGTFYIDRIDCTSFPDQTKVTGRDGTKKAIQSKLPYTSTFEVGTSLYDLVVGQMSLAGIPVSMMRVNVGDETLSSDMSFDRGTSRWDIVKGALESFGYERFFDAHGNFVVRKYNDPSTTPSAWVFKGGEDGNLVSVDSSVNDSLIYNKIVVTGTPADSESNPVGYYGEAEVADVTAATHRDRIGERVLTIDADWVSSDAECVELAVQRLKIAALESYEINFSSIFYPWMEVGEIVTILDPKALDHEPTRFLLDNLSYPLDLGPMSGTSKRVTFIGDSGNGA